MKRLALAAALLLAGALNAQADINIWANVAKQPRGDAELQVDASYCEQRVGKDLNGRPTTRQFKRCMLGRGWRFAHSKRQPVTREHTWIDPESGLTCKDLKGFGGVIGSIRLLIRAST